MMVVMFAVFYFLIIRPQQKKQKELQKMLSELKKGDDIVTTGGLIGKISGVRGDEITLQVQEGVRIRILRSAIQGAYRATGEAAAKTETKADEKSAEPKAT